MRRADSLDNGGSMRAGVFLSYDGDVYYKQATMSPCGAKNTAPSFVHCSLCPSI